MPVFLRARANPRRTASPASEHPVRPTKAPSGPAPLGRLLVEDGQQLGRDVDRSAAGDRLWLAVEPCGALPGRPMRRPWARRSIAAAPRDQRGFGVSTLAP